MKFYKEIIVTIVVLIVIFSVVGFAIWISSWPEGEIELNVRCLGSDSITLIGDTTGERKLSIYYERNEGSADCEFLFCIGGSSSSLWSPRYQLGSFIISLNDKQLYPGGWGERIRLTHLYDLKYASLVVSPWRLKDCFFENETFTLAWRCDERDYRDHKDFLIRYYNVDKVRSLNWTVPIGFNLSIDDVWLMDHFVEATTSYNGWYTIRGHLNNYNEPWRDVDVDLWFKPDTFETHIEVET